MFSMNLLVNMILLAGLYVIQASGIAVIYGIMRVINLAHAGAIMLGAYASYWLFTIFGIDPLLSAAPIMLLFFFVGVLIEKMIISPVFRSRSDGISASLLALFGVWLVMQSIAQELWSATERTVLTGYTFDSISIGTVIIPMTRLAAFGVGFVAFIGLIILLQYTHLGRMIRAVAQDREGALLAGIDVKLISAIAFGIGFALAGLAGVVLSLLFPVSPTVGSGALLVRSFVIVILGGMESIPGVAIGALILAALDTFGIFLFPPGVVGAAPFLLLLVILLILPNGISSLFRRVKLREIQRVRS